MQDAFTRRRTVASALSSWDVATKGALSGLGQATRHGTRRQKQRGLPKKSAVCVRAPQSTQTELIEEMFGQISLLLFSRKTARSVVGQKPDGGQIDASVYNLFFVSCVVFARATPTTRQAPEGLRHAWWHFPSLTQM